MVFIYQNRRWKWCCKNVFYSNVLEGLALIMRALSWNTEVDSIINIFHRRFVIWTACWQLVWNMNRSSKPTVKLIAQFFQRI